MILLSFDTIVDTLEPFTSTFLLLLCEEGS